MNQRGEATLFCVLILVVLSGLLTLSALELQLSYDGLKKRTHLFLCVKETKGELNYYLMFMGRTNWALKNLTKVQVITAFIPGLQGVSANADKAKKMIKQVQNAGLLPYMKKVHDLKRRGCPLDPQMLSTPFQLSGKGYKRGLDEAALIRKEKWTYYFLKKPYLLNVSIDASGYESVKPRITYHSEEKGAMLSSLLSSR